MSHDPMFLQDHHVVAGFYPVADITNSGAIASDIICMKHYEVATFFFFCGVSTGGTSDGLITVFACDDNAATNAVVMPFDWWECVSSTTVDTWTGPTATATTGATMTGASNQIYAAEVTAAAVLAAGLGDTPQHNADWVKVVWTEQTAHAIVGGIYCILSHPRSADSTMPTALA